MPIRLKAFPSELKITPPPFDFMLAAAQENQKRIDAVDKSIGTMQGNFAALNAAPGHEGLAKGLTDDFNGKLNTIISQNPDLTSREATRQLAALSSEFLANQDVKTVVQSFDWWSKNGDKVWASQTKGDIIKAPGILDVIRNEQGQFNYNFKPNKTKYDWGTFGVTPYAPITETLNKEFAIVKPRVAESMGYETRIIGGKEHYFDTKTHTEIKDEKLFGPTVKALKKLILENPESNEAFRYINGSAEYEKDPNAYVEGLIKRHVVPFYSEETTQTESHLGSQGDGSDGTSTEKTKLPPSNIGATSTITRPYLDDASGNPITTTGQLDAAMTENSKKILLTKGSLTTEFPELDALEKLKGIKQGDGSIHPGAFIIDPNTGFEVINEKLLGPLDPIKKAQFNDANMKLTNTQVAQRAFTSKRAYFLEKAGLNPALPLDKQLELNVVEQAKYAGVDAINNPHDSWLYTHDDTGDGTPTLGRSMMIMDYGGFNPLEDDKFAYTDNKGFLVSRILKGTGGAPLRLSTSENLSNHLKAVENWVGTNGNAEQKLRLKNATKDREEVNSMLLETFERGKDGYLKENSLKYKKFSQLLENDLTTAGQLSVFNYTFSGEDKTRLKDATIVAAKAGNFDKLRFDLKDNLPFRYDSKGAENKNKLIEKNVIEKFWQNDNTTYSPRFDEYTNQWVVDVIGSEGAYTVRGVEGVAQMVSKVDPNFTNQYLSSQKKFFGEMDASEGAYATLVSPNKDGSITNMVVRRAEQTHGDIQEDDYMFTVPELPGKVLVARNYNPIYRFMELYNLEKQKSAPDITNLVANGISNGDFSLNIKDETYGGIGHLYFPTANSKSYYVGK